MVGTFKRGSGDACDTAGVKKNVCLLEGVGWGGGGGTLDLASGDLPENSRQIGGIIHTTQPQIFHFRQGDVD